MTKRYYPPFNFKQFIVEHDKSSMKLGVDGVLLACWSDQEGVNSILDIGSGCGIISLVCAQRNPVGSIQALEIEDGAFEESEINFKNSPWSERLKVDHTSFQEFLKDHEVEYDLIISNPPYFIDSLNAQNKERSLARHNVDFDFDLFFEYSEKSMTNNGKLCLVFPYDKLSFLEEKAKKQGLFLSRIAYVKPFEHKPPKRVLLEFRKEKQDPEEETFAIEITRGVYTEKYVSLVKEFYLHF